MVLWFPVIGSANNATALIVAGRLRHQRPPSGFAGGSGLTFKSLIAFAIELNPSARINAKNPRISIMESLTQIPRAAPQAGAHIQVHTSA